MSLTTWSSDPHDPIESMVTKEGGSAAVEFCGSTLEDESLATEASNWPAEGGPDDGGSGAETVDACKSLATSVAGEAPKWL